ncbi:HlyC/CorC family transporter [Rhodovibrionaceae bacterium A322]
MARSALAQESTQTGTAGSAAGAASESGTDPADPPTMDTLLDSLMGLDSEILLPLLAIVGLLVLSGFFSGSETALTAASRVRMHSLEQDGNKRAGLVNRLWLQKERMIGAILLGNNLVNILASALATSLLITLFGEAGVVYATLAMTLLVLIFSEVLPKTYALQDPEQMALRVAPIMRVVVFVLSPFTRLVQLVVSGTLRLFGTRIEATYGSDQWEEVLRGAIELHKGEGADEENKHESEMLSSILDLDDVEVSEIMLHRSKVTTINIDLPNEKIIEAVLESPYTRLPLWKDEPDNIIGVLHAKALFREVRSNDGSLDDIDFLKTAADPWFIPETTNLLTQLQAFRQRKEHFAIVVDEYGEMLGIVTLEDILEEIVGDISDEHDEKVEGVEHLPDGSAVVDGTVTIRDLNRHYGWRLPDEEAATVAGLILYESRRIPEVGQSFAFHGFRFEVLGRQRHQITLVKVTQLDRPSETEQAESDQQATG